MFGLQKPCPVYRLNRILSSLTFGRLAVHSKSPNIPLVPAIVVAEVGKTSVSLPLLSASDCRNVGWLLIGRASTQGNIALGHRRLAVGVPLPGWGRGMSTKF